MTEEKSGAVVGYQLEEVYASEQRHEIVADESLPSSDEDRDLGFSWDWRIPSLPEDLELDPESSESHSVWFDVAIGAKVGPASDDPNQYQVTLVGSFIGRLREEVPLHEFARLNAVAILFPYLRQCIANLSGWAPRDAYHLPILNIGGLMQGVTPEDSEGWRQLQEHSDLAEYVGLQKDGTDPSG